MPLNPLICRVPFRAEQIPKVYVADGLLKHRQSEIGKYPMFAMGRLQTVRLQDRLFQRIVRYGWKADMLDAATGDANWHFLDAREGFGRCPRVSKRDKGV
jgi:hypothetical protein